MEEKTFQMERFFGVKLKSNARNAMPMETLWGVQFQC